MRTRFKHTQCRVGLSASALDRSHLPTSWCTPVQYTLTSMRWLRSRVCSARQSISHRRLGDLGKGWLELCTEEDYQAAAGAACGAAVAPCASHVRMDPPQIEERATAPLWPCVEAGVVLHALSPGFDARSREMYRQLRMMREQDAHAPFAQPAP